MSQNAEKNSDYRIGHRERMRVRLLSGESDKMSDCDLLEMLLMCAIPRKDVKPLARELLVKFGSFAEVISAPFDELKSVKGIGDAVISFFVIIKQSALRLLKTEIKSEPVINNLKKLIDYCIAKSGRDKVESVRVMFFDTGFSLLTDELFVSGTIDRVTLFPREVIRRIIAVDATSIVLVHNHPSGDVEPSTDDIAMTKNLIAAVYPLGVNLIDHIIISKTGYTSFKLRGLI